MIANDPPLPSAWPCFGSKVGGQNNYRVPHELLKANRVPQGAWLLEPPVATVDASDIIRGH